MSNVVVVEDKIGDINDLYFPSGSLFWDETVPIKNKNGSIIGKTSLKRSDKDIIAEEVKSSLRLKPEIGFTHVYQDEIIIAEIKAVVVVG